MDLVLKITVTVQSKWDSRSPEVEMCWSKSPNWKEKCGGMSDTQPPPSLTTRCSLEQASLLPLQMCLMVVMSHLLDEIMWSPMGLMESGVGKVHTVCAQLNPVL